MYEIFNKLLEERNLKAADVCRGTGLPSSLFSEWKRGKSTPKADKMKKIADFFEVSVEYLLTGEEAIEKSKPTLTPKDERDIEKKLTETLDQIVSGDGLMFNGEVMDEQTKQLLEISLRNTLESAKITAKKFTPKKYK